MGQDIEPQQSIATFMPQIMKHEITLADFNLNIPAILKEIREFNVHGMCGVATPEELVDIFRIKIVAGQSKVTRDNVLLPVMEKVIASCPELAKVIVAEYPSTLAGVKSKDIFRGSVSCSIPIKLENKIDLENKFGTKLKNVDTLKLMVRIFVDPGITDEKGVVKYAEYNVGKKAKPATDTTAPVSGHPGDSI